MRVRVCIVTSGVTNPDFSGRTRTVRFDYRTRNRTSQRKFKGILINLKRQSTRFDLNVCPAK